VVAATGAGVFVVIGCGILVVVTGCGVFAIAGCGTTDCFGVTAVDRDLE
jgi:hypothetical protein